MSSGFVIVATRTICFGAIVSLVLLLLGSICFILLQILIVCRACQQALSLSSTVNRGEGFLYSGKGLSAGDLEKLPCYEFSAPEKKGGAAMDCAVCLESFELGDRCRQLPVCRHSFHARCVDCWLVRSIVCPICRSCAVHRRGGDEVARSSD